ncbi:MAG: regulatory signaling modulator protein AmpE [Woeseiaceae bacterium]|nr:regulatory signaling modulator protein AmpE [Woeseiaceae bacterium]
MKLIALLAGLLIERLATQLFHLRQLRWLDSMIDAGFEKASGASGIPPLVAVVLLAVLLVLPLLLLLYFFGELFYGLAYLVIAVVVLFFSLGPKDIGEQVDDYCEAIEADDEEEIRRTAKALLEREVSEDAEQRVRDVEAAVCVQANNRLFAVIFWFVLLGPVGAWSYRVTDLIRRRAVFAVSRDEIGDADAGAGFSAAASTVHGWLAWIPARLTALGFALAGSFDRAIAAWREPSAAPHAAPREDSERLLARVGTAALDLSDLPDESIAERGIRGATAANGLVFRLLGIWAVIIAAMTLYGWSL